MDLQKFIKARIKEIEEQIKKASTLNQSNKDLSVNDINAFVRESQRQLATNKRILNAIGE